MTTAAYILAMSCVSGDDVEVMIHHREDIVPWLKVLDHEGSDWAVFRHDAGHQAVLLKDITEEIVKEYRAL